MISTIFKLFSIKLKKNDYIFQGGKMLIQEEFQKSKILSNTLNTVDIFVTLATISTFVKLFVIAFGIKVITFSNKFCFCLSLTSQALFVQFLNNYNVKEKEFRRAQKISFSFDKLYRKSLQNNVTDKKAWDFFCNILTRYVNKMKEDCLSERSASLSVRQPDIKI